MNTTETQSRHSVQRLVRPHRSYVFFRAEGFYPLELTSDDEARMNAENNPGTLRVENLNGETVWPNTKLRHRRYEYSTCKQ